MDVLDEYVMFAEMVDKMPVSSFCSEYIRKMERGNMVSLNPSYRSTLDIVKEIGNGDRVRDWKKRSNHPSIVIQINRLCSQEMFKIFSDLLYTNYSVIAAYLPRLDLKERVGSYREALQKGCLKTYFGDHDIFCIAEGENNNYICEYSGDYYAYVNETLTLLERVNVYRNYLVRNRVTIPIRYNSYGNPIYFVDVAERQMAEYERVLAAVADKTRFNFIGDGLGIGAMLAIKNGWKYASSEKNLISDIVVKLGICERECSAHPDDILALFNVEEYLSKEDISDLREEFPKRLIYNDSFSSELGEKVKGHHGRLYVQGIRLEGFETKPIARSEVYLYEHGPVCPVDPIAASYVEELKVPVAKDGLKVSYKDRENSFNIRTRKFPGNMRFARKGDVKVYQNIKFKFEKLGQTLKTDNEIFKYYPNDLDNMYLLDRGKYHVDKEYVVAVIPNPRRIRKYVSPEGLIVPLYYVYSKECKGVVTSFFSEKNLGLSPIEGMDTFVIKDNG